MGCGIIGKKGVIHMKICTTCKEIKEMYHGRKCFECRSEYQKNKSKKRREKECPQCDVRHNRNTKECSKKCKILNRKFILNDCWKWTGKINCNGYGTFKERIEGKKVDLLAHRVSYEEFVGKIPTGFFVCHKCDTRDCVNPDHLFIGTHSDNMQDMIKKKRQNYPSGELAGRSKISQKIADEMRVLFFSGKTRKEISKLFGICRPHVSQILLNRLWRV